MGHERRVHGGLDPGHADVVRGSHGLLGIIDAERLDRANRADRLRGRVGLVVVHAQADLITACLAHAGNNLNVVQDAPAELQSECAQPLLVEPAA